MVVKNMKLAEPCKICESTRWCGRACIHAPTAEAANAAQLAAAPIDRKPIAQLLQLAEARVIVLENELEQVRTEVGSLRAAAGEPPECPVCAARREKQRAIMVAKRAAEKAAK
jgi:hypothetical protein